MLKIVKEFLEDPRGGWGARMTSLATNETIFLLYALIIFHLHFFNILTSQVKIYFTRMYLLQVIRETNPQSSDYSSLPYVMQIFIAKESEDLAQLY